MGPDLSQLCSTANVLNPFQVHWRRRSRLCPLLPAIPAPGAYTQPRILELHRCAQRLHSYRYLRRPRRSHAGSPALLVYKGLEVCKWEAMQALQLLPGRVLQGMPPPQIIYIVPMVYYGILLMQVCYTV
jgi:hypothetical protein